MVSFAGEGEVRLLELQALCFRLYLDRNSDDKSSTTSEEALSDEIMKDEESKSLSMNQKLEIATSVLGDIQHEIFQRNNSHRDRVDAIHIMLEEINLRLVDLEKDAFTFKRDVVAKINDEDTNIVNFERVLRYFCARILCLESILGRLQLQHSDCRRKLKKFLIQSRQRDTIGTTIHFLDFHRIQIDLKRQVQNLNKKTNYLARVKLIVSKYHKNLTAVMDKVREVENKLHSTEGAIALRQKHIMKLDMTMKNVNEKIKKDMSTKPKNPNTETIDIMDMVGRQCDLYNAKKEFELLKRKVQINAKRNHMRRRNF